MAADTATGLVDCCTMPDASITMNDSFSTLPSPLVRLEGNLNIVGCDLLATSINIKDLAPSLPGTPSVADIGVWPKAKVAEIFSGAMIVAGLKLLRLGARDETMVCELAELPSPKLLNDLSSDVTVSLAEAVLMMVELLFLSSLVKEESRVKTVLGVEAAWGPPFKRSVLSRGSGRGTGESGVATARDVACEELPPSIERSTVEVGGVLSLSSAAFFA